MSVGLPVHLLASAGHATRRLAFVVLAGITLVAAAVALTVSLLVASAFAQDGPPPHEGPWSIDVGGGAIVYNTYPGSSSYHVLPVPYYSITYDDTVFASFPDLLKVDALHAITGATPTVQIGPLLQFRFGRTRHDSSRLQGLTDVGNTVAAGAYATWTVTDWFALNADISQGLSANSGLLGNLRATLSHRFGPLLVAGGPTLGFANGTYMKSFYGITPPESAASGRPVYNTSGGLLAPGAAATLVMPITDKIAVTTVANYGRLVGSAAGSPVVKQGGSANQFFGGLFVTYTLF